MRSGSVAAFLFGAIIVGVSAVLAVFLLRERGYFEDGFAEGLAPGQVRQVQLPLAPPPWGYRPSAVRWAERLGASHVVKSADGRHAFAMIPALSLEAELALLSDEASRSRARSLRARFPRRGMYVLDGSVPRLLWESKHQYVGDPACVLAPNGGHHLIWLYWPEEPTIGFCVDGEGTGDRALSRLGRGGTLGSHVRLALREDRGTLEVLAPGVGHFELALDDGTMLPHRGLRRLNMVLALTSVWYLAGVVVGLARLVRDAAPVSVVGLAVWIGTYACALALLLSGAVRL